MEKPFFKQSRGPLRSDPNRLAVSHHRTAVRLVICRERVSNNRCSRSLNLHQLSTQQVSSISSAAKGKTVSARAMADESSSKQTDINDSAENRTPQQQQQQPAMQHSKGFSNVGLEDLRQQMESFAAERNWQQFHTPRNLLLALVGEVGELSEIFQWRGEVSAGLPGFSPADVDHVGEELSDVLLYLVRLADVCGVDLGAAVQHKMAHNAAKYPAEHCRGSAAKYTAYTSTQRQQQQQQQESIQQQQEQKTVQQEVQQQQQQEEEQDSSSATCQAVERQDAHQQQQQQQQEEQEPTG